MIRSQRSVVGFQQNHDASETVPLSLSAQATPKKDESRTNEGTMGLGVRLRLSGSRSPNDAKSGSRMAAEWQQNGSRTLSFELLQTEKSSKNQKTYVEEWCTGQDLNLEPSDSKSEALSN